MELKIGESKQENIVIEWLLNQDDNFLKDAIKKCPDEDFKKCWEYIKGLAKAKAENGCAMIEEETVYNWAKEYFIDYEARKQKQEELRKENEAKALKQRITDTLTSVKNQADTLKNNLEYKDLQEKYKLDLITWENELKMGLVKDNKRVDEINKGLALIIDDINALRPKGKEEQAQDTKKPVKEEIKQMSLFDF